MWDMVKNDPLLKAIVIIFLGLLGFGFAFNIMFGSNSSGMEHGMAGGYSLDANLGYVLALLIKLLLIAIVIAALVAVIKYTHKYLFKNNDIKVLDTIKDDPALKTLSIVILSVLTMIIIFMLFGSSFAGNGGYMLPNNYSYSMNVGFSMYGIIQLLIKLLLTISIIGLIAGLGMYAFQYSNENADKSKDTKKENDSKLKCSKCETTIKAEWKCCPTCGEDLETEDEN